MKSIFIAGATGVIGRSLIPLLQAADYAVHAVTRDPAKARALAAAGVRATVCDVYDVEMLKAAVAQARPEVVVHELTDLPQSSDERGDPAALARNARVRVEGTPNLVAAALHAGASRMVAQSLAFAYAAGPEPHVESDPLDTQTRGSVITLERLVLQSPPLAGTVLRYGSLYGPGTWFAEPTGNTPVSVEAAARATLLAIERAASGIFNIAEERGYVDCTRARSVLGWVP